MLLQLFKTFRGELFLNTLCTVFHKQLITYISPRLESGRVNPLYDGHSSTQYPMDGMNAKEAVGSARRTKALSRVPVISPRQKLVVMLKDAIEASGSTWSSVLDGEVPRRWEIHGDLMLLSEASFTSNEWAKLGSDLWLLVSKALRVARVAKKRRILTDGYRTPQVELMLGQDPWVTHMDNGIVYTFDVTKSMFSSGNITEKLRIAKMDCENETVVDMFAGIGYFTLPYLMHAKAELVYACEWNPAAVLALRQNLMVNHVQDKCIILVGDNLKVCPANVADRVNLGLIPSSERCWEMACRALKVDVGGILHVHGNVDSKTGHFSCPNKALGVDPLPTEDSLTSDCRHGIPHNKALLGVFGNPNTTSSSQSSKQKQVWFQWANHVRCAIATILAKLYHDSDWTVTLKHLEPVKSYAAHVQHIVVDLDCRPQSS